MSHLLYLMFRYDGDVMESLDFGVVFEGSKHTLSLLLTERYVVSVHSADVAIDMRCRSLKAGRL